MASSSPQKLRIEPLTSARFLAALFVVLHHTFPPIASNNSVLILLRRLFGIGYISVSFFFMLSGFILALVYLDNEKPLEKRRFFLARFARIYPLYLAAMLLDLPHFVHAHFSVSHQSFFSALWQFLATLLLIQSWFDIRSLNPPGWSLSAEAFFYLIFPFAGLVLWKLKDRFVMLASLAIYVTGIFLVMLITAASGIDEQHYNPLPHLFIFLLGILLAKIFTRMLRIPHQARMLDQCAPAMLFVALASIVAIPLTGFDHHTALLQHILLAPVFALAIMALASGSPTVVRLFSAPWLILLGEASYALYLIHYPIHSALRAILEKTGWIGFILYLVGVIALSIASYKFFEAPARRWILSKVHIRSKETAVTSSLAQ